MSARGATRGWRRCAVAIAVGLLAAAGCGRDEEESRDRGISPREVKIGGSFPYSGPASVYGSIAEGAKAYFALVNQRGGVDGRRIRFLALDDGYLPSRAVENARRLVEREGVFAVFGNVGTANNLAVWDYLNEREVPHLYVTTGADQWGASPESRPYTIGFPPPHAIEARVFAEYLRRVRPAARVAVLYQNDDYGRGVLEGFEAAIEGGPTRIIARQSYESTDPTVSPQVARLARSGADTFLSITTPKQAAQAISTIAEIGWKPLHLLDYAAAIKSAAIAPAGFENAQGIVSLTFYKDPQTPQWAQDPAMREYRSSVRRFAPRADPDLATTAYGWAAAQTLVAALRRMEEPTQEALMDAVRDMDVQVPMLVPGVRVKTGPGDGYPIESMQVMRFRGENWQLEGDVISVEKQK